MRVHTTCSNVDAPIPHAWPSSLLLRLSHHRVVSGLLGARGGAPACTVLPLPPAMALDSPLHPEEDYGFETAGFVKVPAATTAEGPRRHEEEARL